MNVELKILASRVSDSMEGWGWINKNLISENGFYQLKSENRKIIIYLRTIDDNYIDSYNDSKRTLSISHLDDILVINEYYRMQLGIKYTGNKIIIDLKKCSFIQRIFMWDFLHPNPYVRHSSRMSLFSLLVGIIALIFTINWCKLWVFILNCF